MRRLMVSALGNRIYLTNVKEVKGKPGLFMASGKKEDYTDEAIRAVFEWFMNNYKENEPAEAYEVTFPGSGYKLIMVKKEAQE